MSISAGSLAAGDGSACRLPDGGIGQIPASLRATPTNGTILITPRLLYGFRNFVTAGAACASDKMFEQRGCWVTETRFRDVHSPGTKRDFEGLPALLWCSWGPSKKSGRDHLKDLARNQGWTVNDALRYFCVLLDAKPKDILAALDTGEALRCRFLVPTTPARNATPDKLSAQHEPEWLSPTSTGGDSMFDSAAYETAEIMAGMS
jgi:hypothetical protein